MKKYSLLVLAIALVSSLACSPKKNASGSNSDVAAPSLTAGLAQSTKGDIVAELDGQPITEKDLLEKIKPRLSSIENQLFDIKRDGIDEIIEGKLLEKEAQKRHITTQELLKSEIDDKIGDVSQKEIEDFYETIKSRVNGKTLEELKPQITAQLRGKRGNTYHINLIDRLMAQASVDVYIKRPKVDVAIGNSPSMGGSASAPVTVIEFTDFQCPYCSRARPTITEVLNNYKGDVHYVMRNFPLQFHAQAKKAAAAGLCANDQKKYWEYTKVLWDNQSALDVPNLKKYASDLHLDSKKFDDCLDSDKFMSVVNSDQQEGLKAGVTGTPSFFINGQMLTGAQPVEAFKKLIDEELREAKRKKS
ncbi:MAG: thioredoxin domain-containing protein [Deltaproteobacteria bacterium]|nr:thioredoxin domain-containing protein [Deltaproteobacteria bacterium]